MSRFSLYFSLQAEISKFPTEKNRLTRLNSSEVSQSVGSKHRAEQAVVIAPPPAAAAAAAAASSSLLAKHRQN